MMKEEESRIIPRFLNYTFRWIPEVEETEGGSVCGDANVFGPV